MELPLRQKLFYFFPVLLCFCLPFGSRITSLLIALWVVLSFFNLEKEPFQKGLRQPALLLMLGFFVFTGISALFSHNKSGAAFSVEVKLAFLFFPYLFFCFRWPIEILKRCIVSFVSGCFFACVYLIVRAFYYSLNGQPEYFFYTLFSDLIHSSYFAMYLVLCIILVLLFYKKWFSAQRQVLISAYFFVAVFVVTIFLCSSKLGIISFFICMPLLFLHKWKDRLSWKVIALTFVVLIALLFAAARLFPDSLNRLNSITSMPQHIDKTSSESTTVRILIWKEALQVIREHVLLGTGAGDDNAALYEAYEQNGLSGAFAHKFNAHNQFLQSFIGLGIIGFLMLLLMTFGSLIRGIVRKHFLVFLFSLIIILNFLVESMLQTAAGVLFFAFFFCLFHLVDEEALLGD